MRVANSAHFLPGILAEFKLGPLQATHADLAAEEQELDQIWPDGPLAIDAYDIHDLEDPRGFEVIKSLLSLAIERNRREIVVLNVERLVNGADGRDVIQQMYVLKAVLFRACRQMDIPMPRLLLERQQEHLDLRIFPRKPRLTVCEVIPFPSPSRA